MGAQTKSEIEFAVFLLHHLSRIWKKSVPDTYRILSDTGILQNYIIPCYDVLHTQGESYLLDDITSFARERGALV